MKWIFLLIAGLLEISWAVGLKFSHGFSQLIPSIITLICMILSFYFLALSLKELPLGTAYAVWTGIGTLGTVILGIILFKEPVTILRILCIALILSGITGLKLLTHWYNIHTIICCHRKYIENIINKCLAIFWQ